MTPKAVALRRRLQAGGIVRVMGAHNGLGARLIERSGFDAIWASGLEISSAHGLPDANILTMTENLDAARAIHEATTLPVICDCDTGYGNASNVKHMVRRYEAAGLAALVIEDKMFPKVNSFIPGGQDLAPVEEFSGRIRAAKEAQTGPDLMVFARIEALIAGFGLEEALRRAHAYADAGADGIVIHSKSSSAEEVVAFSRRWNRRLPLVAIPTTYFKITAEELEREGFSMVIYANQGLRAAIRAMEETFRTIRQTGTTAGIEQEITSMKQVFELQGMKTIGEDEKRFSGAEVIRAVIPAARDHRFQPDLKELLQNKPLCMLEIGGKTLLDRQLDALRSAGVTDVTVVGGHQVDKIKADGAELLFNPDYKRGNCAQSILRARERFAGKTVLVYSDILFDRQILERLLKSPHPITLVMDSAYRSLPVRDKILDRVILDGPEPGDPLRKLSLDIFKPILKVGHRMDPALASHEFIGIAFLQDQGVEQLERAWDEARTAFGTGPFYEAPSVEQADLTDLLCYIRDRGFPVYGMEIERGWSEIHSRDDYKRACAHFEKPSLTLR